MKAITLLVVLALVAFACADDTMYTITANYAMYTNFVNALETMATYYACLPAG